METNEGRSNGTKPDQKEPTYVDPSKLREPGPFIHEGDVAELPTGEKYKNVGHGRWREKKPSDGIF